MMSASYSPDDNKLRLYSVARLDPETYKKARELGFIYAPKQGLFVAPMWTPEREDFLIEICSEIGDEDKSLVQRQEERAERFDEYSDKRKQDSVRAKDAVKSLADGIPLGQPILIGHHSQRRAEKDAEKIERGIQKAVKMWETSVYWQQRAAGALAHAKHKELPQVRARRIKKIQAEKRSWERTKKELVKLIEVWSKDGLTQQEGLNLAYSGPYNFSWKKTLCPEYAEEGYDGRYSASVVLRPDGERFKSYPAMPIEKVQAIAKEYLPKRLPRIERWIAHCENRIAYETAMLGEQGKLDLIAKKPRPKQLPICNYKQEVFKVSSPYYGKEYEHLTQVEMTQDEWNKIYVESKGTRTCENSHRVRIAYTRKDGILSRNVVFITDAKVHAKPEPIPDVPKITMPREFNVPCSTVPYKPESKDNEIEAMKSSLKEGVKIVVANQLFPTPPDVCERMVELADIQVGDLVLEPSAGTGNIIRAIRENAHGYVLDALEINFDLCKQLRAMDIEVAHRDFLEFNAQKYNKILMNPPFENGVDIKHIKHALSLLKDVGKLVAICANGPRQNEQLKEMSSFWEVLPEGTFKNQGTNTNTVLLVIDK